LEPAAAEVVQQVCLPGRLVVRENTLPLSFVTVRFLPVNENEWSAIGAASLTSAYPPFFADLIADSYERV
jgi:hypothetical protein